MASCLILADEKEFIMRVQGRANSFRPKGSLGVM